MSIIAKLWPRRQRRKVRPALGVQRRRLSVEALEDRQCLSVVAAVGVQASAIAPTQVQVTWDDQPTEAGYNVLEWDGTQQTQLAALPADTTTYTANNQLPGHKVWFSVQAIDGNGGNAQSDWQAVVLPAEPITAPTSVQATATSSTQVALTWSGATGATSYQVFEWDGSKGVQIANLSATSLPVSGLSPATTYYFYIQASNDSNAAVTDWVSVETPAAPLTAPSRFTLAAASATEIDLSWGTSAGATGYNVYRWISGKAVEIASLGADATHYAVTKLKPATSYWFYVQAVNQGNYADTDWKMASTPLKAPLVAPHLSARAAGSTRAALSWTASAQAAGYRVYEYSGTHWTLVKTVSTTTLRATVTGLKPGTTTWFLVQAYTANNLNYANSKPVALTH